VDLKIRRMRQGDLEAALAIAGSLKEAPQWPRAAYEAAIDECATPWRLALVAEVLEEGAEEVAGFAVASLIAGVAELESIAVAACFQRRGVAAGLLQSLLERLRDAGATEIVLEVRPSNEAALALYGRAGWVRVGVRTGYYRDPEEDAVILGMRL
jgi:ribosomal-protein-alanine N-acetyltransferase